MGGTTPKEVITALTIDSPISIYYGCPASTGDTLYAVKTVFPDERGYFETTIGCPAGKNMKIRSSASAYGSSAAKKETTGSGSTYIMSNTFFYGETAEVSVPCGSATFCDLKLVPKAYTSSADLVQP